TIELVQLAAFAFPAYPSRFTSVPYAPAMQQDKALVSARRGTVTMVQPGDRLCRRCQQSIVIVGMFAHGVLPVGQQCEMKGAFRACQVMHLQALDLLLDF